MSVLTIDEAKMHQKIDHDDDDADVQLKLDAAESMVAQFIGRYFYKDEAAVSEAFNQIESIQVVTEAEINKLNSMALGEYKDIYQNLAGDKKRDLMREISMLSNAIIFNSQLRVSVLLTFGYLYETREDVDDLPQAARNIAQPFRINLGV